MARKKGSKNKTKKLSTKEFFEQARLTPEYQEVKARVEATESLKTPVYTLSLAVNDRIHESTGETLEEALNNIKIEPTRGVLKIYTKGIIKVKKGEKEIERLLFIRQMSRLFGVASKLAKECAMARTTRLFRALLEDNRTK